MWLQIYRSFSLAGKNFWRYFGLSLMTITILVMSLISVDLVLVVNALTKTALNLVEERIDVSLLFKPRADAKIIEELRGTLSRAPAVKSVTFFDREEVLERFRDKHKENQAVLAALEELDENPFGASIIVRAASSRDYEEVISALDVPEYQQAIEKTTFDDHSSIIKRIGLITSRIQKFGLTASAVLLLVSFLIIFNIIRVAIYTHREEISIMKLVGATNWFVRSPFFIEVTINSVLALLIGTSLFYFALWFSEPHLNQFFGGDEFSLVKHFNQNWFSYFGGQFLALLALNLVSAALAMRKFLKS